MKRIARMIRAGVPFSFDGRKVTTSCFQKKKWGTAAHRISAGLQSLDNLLDQFRETQRFLTSGNDSLANRSLVLNGMANEYNEIVQDIMALAQEADSSVMRFISQEGLIVKKQGWRFIDMVFGKYYIDGYAGNDIEQKLAGMGDRNIRYSYNADEACITVVIDIDYAEYAHQIKFAARSLHETIMNEAYRLFPTSENF